MSKKFIKEAEIPYAELEKAGLTRQMIEDLPEDVQEKILAGRLSPVLPLAVSSRSGHVYEGRGRFSFFTREDGSVGVHIHPVMEPLGDRMFVSARNTETGEHEIREIASSDLYSQQVLEQLREGRVVLGEMLKEDGGRERAFLQLDDETQQIIAVPARMIAPNLQAVSLGLDLSASEDACLQNGHLVSYSNEEDEQLTIGLDLQSPTGIRFAVGDERKWMDNRKRDWDKYELGVNGCWMTDDDGNLQYISDEEFEEYDVWNEMEKQRDRKAHAEIPHRGMPIK